MPLLTCTCEAKDRSLPVLKELVQLPKFQSKQGVSWSGRLELWPDGDPEKLRRRERSARESRQVYGSLEIEHFVDPYSDRRTALSLGSYLQRGRTLLDAIHIVPEFRTVIDCRDVVPGSERM